MSDGEEQAAPGVSVRVVEIAVALIFIAVAALVMVDSIRVGMLWDDNKPEPGYFPFYIGLLMAIASTVVLGQAALSKKARQVFVSNKQLRSVLSLLVPTTIYVAVIVYLGIYVSSALYLAVFMRRLGHYRWPMVAAISVAVPAALFVLFELWFQVPLPKGPFEEWLGY